MRYPLFFCLLTWCISYPLYANAESVSEDRFVKNEEKTCKTASDCDAVDDGVCGWHIMNKDNVEKIKSRLWGINCFVRWPGSIPKPIVKCVNNLCQEDALVKEEERACKTASDCVAMGDGFCALYVVNKNNVEKVKQRLDSWGIECNAQQQPKGINTKAECVNNLCQK